MRVFIIFLIATTVSIANDFIPGEFVVLLKQKTKQKRLKQLGGLSIKSAKSLNVKIGELYLVKTDKTLDHVTVLNQLKSDPMVKKAEPNYRYKLIEPIVESNTQFSDFKTTPSDSLWIQMWGLHNTGVNEPDRKPRDGPGVKGADISALKAWKFAGKDAGKVKVAVIDTGIDYTHPDLKSNMWINELEANGVPGVDDDENGYIDDVYGYDFANLDGDPMDGHSHGTHCAGTIAARHDGAGSVGVVDRVQLVAVKFLADNGSGSLDRAIKAIDYAATVNVDIMSNSWGGGPYSEILESMIQYAANQGIIFVAAAGNSSLNNDITPQYPASYKVDNVISVGALKAQNKLAEFSNYGKTSVHIAAPGKRIISTTPKSKYRIFSGTSMAAPHVSGALAMLVAREGRLPHLEMRDRLQRTSEPVQLLDGKISQRGRLDLYNLLTNTSPDRSDIPDPNNWVEFPVEKWETAHPYANEHSEWKQFQAIGAKFIRLKVNRIDLEKPYDRIDIYDKYKTLYGKATGYGTNKSFIHVPGDTLLLHFSTDNSYSKWGFEIDKVEVQF